MNSELAEFVLQINEKIQTKAAASTLSHGDALEEGHESQGEALTSDENSDGEDGFDASTSASEETVTVSLLSLLKVIKQPTLSKSRSEYPTGTPRLRKHFLQLAAILVPTASANAKKGVQTQASISCGFSQLSQSSERPECNFGRPR